MTKRESYYAYITIWRYNGLINDHALFTSANALNSKPMRIYNITRIAPDDTKSRMVGVFVRQRRQQSPTYRQLPPIPLGSRPPLQRDISQLSAGLYTDPGIHPLESCFSLCERAPVLRQTTS